MRLWFLATLTMFAFAANSLLNRAAVDSGAMDPGAFAVLRVLAGALTLVVLCRLQGKPLTFTGRNRLIGAGSLTLYMIGFSLAYLALDAGLGALVLFGMVQITMFVVSALRGQSIGALAVLGAVVAFCGLAWVLRPDTEVSVDLVAAGFMVAAGIGWGLYSLAGKAEPDALAGTAGNFVLALPLTAAAVWIFGAGWNLSGLGILLAIVSGVVTSGMGYALWYRVLPQLQTQVAATLQMTVPIIAIVAGILFLSEAASPRLLLGTALVLGGIALTIFASGRAAKGSNT